MNDREDPLADPLAAPEMTPGGLIAGVGPQCPRHGRMTYEQPGTAETCWIIQLDIRASCMCQPGQFTCGGLDGEGCETEPVSLRDYLASLR
jgi:hypothetical protein